MTTYPQFKCPHCGLLSFYSPENPSRPFCSERCKLIDLGQWASEGYKVPIAPTEGYLDDLEAELESANQDNSTQEFKTKTKVNTPDSDDDDAL